MTSAQRFDVQAMNRRTPIQVHGENEAAIKSNKYYILLKYATISWLSIERKIVITMRYCNKSKTEISVG